MRQVWGPSRSFGGRGADASADPGADAAPAVRTIRSGSIRRIRHPIQRAPSSGPARDEDRLEPRRPVGVGEDVEADGRDARDHLQQCRHGALAATGMPKSIRAKSKRRRSLAAASASTDAASNRGSIATVAATTK